MVSFKQLHRGSLLLLALSCAAASGCGGDDSPMQSGQMAIVQGKVTDDAGLQKTARIFGTVEGATVTLARLQSDGSLSTVSGASAQTDANGVFSVEADIEAASDVIVVAQKNNQTWKAVVSAEVRRGQTRQAQPMNDESTSEAEMRERHAENNRDEDVQYADEASYIDASVAAELAGNVQALDQLALAMESEAEAHAKALTHASIGATQTQVQNVNSAKAQAQIQLETSLNAAGSSQSAITAAFEAHQQAIVDAYVSAGVKARAYAKSRQPAAKALNKNSASLSATARLALSRSAARFQARATDRACQSQFQESGAASARVTAVASAGVTLRASLASATNDAGIVAAFQAYHDAIIAELQTELSAQAAAIATIDATINGVAGARVTLEAALSVAANTDAIVTAYMNFYSAITTLVEASLSTASQTEIEFAAEVLILANLSL